MINARDEVRLLLLALELAKAAALTQDEFELYRSFAKILRKYAEKI